jgi:hypothetical protein
MARNQGVQKAIKGGEVLNPERIAKSQAMIAKDGSVDTHFLAKFIRQQMADLATDAISPQKANAQCKHALTLLKIAEVEFKWKTSDGNKGKSLMLAAG